MVAEDLHDSMINNDVTLAIVLSSIASLVTLIIVVAVCICCYRPKDDDDEEELPKVAKYQSVEQSEHTKRDDVKLLNKHPWQEAPTKSPHLTRKSIKFERPADKRFVTENVQPDQYSPSSLNRSLGVRSRDALNPTESLGTKNSESRGSAGSSPYHRTLSGESDGAGAAGLDMVPADLPDYPTGGEKLGKIQFSLSYDFQEMTLTLRIVRATDLPAKDFSGTSDPYVKILLLPDKKNKLTTNIKKKKVPTATLR